MITTSKINNVLEIKLPSELDSKFADEMMTESKTWLVMPVETFHFNFKEVIRINANAYRAFIIFAKLVKQGDKNIISLNMSLQHNRQLKNDGIIQVFNPMSNEEISAAATKGDTAKLKEGFDVNIINPFVEAVVSTLQIQAQTPSKPNKPYLLRVEDKTYTPNIGVVGIITLSTVKIKGTIAIVFTESVFLKIYENMFGEKHTEVTSEIQDAAAELLNIIYGTAKTKINQMPGYDLQPAIPTVFSGQKMNLHQKTDEKVIILPFESSIGSFQMEIALEAK